MKVQPYKSRNIEDGRRFESFRSALIIGAITADGKLFQLEPARTATGNPGGFNVYEVNSNGDLHQCAGEDFPKTILSKENAITVFRDWANQNGYEVIGGRGE